eukprot:scaffold17.g578.t1
MSRSFLLVAFALVAAAHVASARSLNQASAPSAAVSNTQAAPGYLGVFSAFNILPSGLGSLAQVDGSTLAGLAQVGFSAAQLNLGPCTVFQPHVHPHPEFAYIIRGTNVTAGVVTTNGSAPALQLQTGLQNGSFAIFPTAQPHFTQNDGCDSAAMLAVFPVPTPGITFLPAVEALFPADTLEASYGLASSAGANAAAAAASLTAGIADATVPFGHLPECVARCGLQASAAPAPAPTTAP